MAELVYAFDLKSNGAIRAGSIPALGTMSPLEERIFVRRGLKKRSKCAIMKELSRHKARSSVGNPPKSLVLRVL